MPIPVINEAVTIITGASSGIGRACALEYARAGAFVVLASRNEGQLRQLAGEIGKSGHAGTGVRVQMIYPGLTDTAFSANSILRGPDTRTYRIKPAPAEKVARVMVRAARGRSRDRHVSVRAHLLCTLSRLSPSLVDAILARALNPRASR